MEDARIQSLADTLKGTGLVSSVSDALRMAKSIIGTEQKVASGFNRYVEPQTKKMTYQEEIDDLIRKTSPEHKNYHVPVRGYRKEAITLPVEEVKKEVKPVFYELDQPVESVATNEVVKEEVKPIVYTDVMSEYEEKPLHEVMNVVDEGDILSNNSITINIAEEEETASDEFIVPVEKELPKPDPVVIKEEPKAEQTEQLFKEIKEDKEKPHEIKNPIEKVDLMNYFKV